MKSREKIQTMPNLGKGITYNFLIAAFALVLTWIFKGPNIDIEFCTAVFVSAVLLALFLMIIAWSIVRKNNDQGPHKYIRHPLYAAIVFLLNPAVAIYFR